MMVVTALALSCGGGEGDDIVTPPNQGNNNGNGQNNNSGETEYVQVKCYACYGSTKCQTCNGTGKGCKDCHGTGKSCDYCNATGKCYKCNGDRNCIDCRGTGDRTCNICHGSGECQNCYKGQCKACNGKGWYYGYTFEVINCTSCYTPGNNYRKGDGKCRSCRGTDKCSKNCKNGKLDCNRCSGTGKCDDCSGTGTCRKCKGTPTCKTCNGDGHCTDCKNSDGKCTICEGTGYTKEKKGTPNPEDEFVGFSSSNIEFTASGEPQTITVTANIEWKIISNTASSWLTVSKIDEKTLQLTVAENTMKEARSGTVTIKGRAKSAELTVTQAEFKDFLTVSEKNVELLPEGETKYITVKTNLEGWYIWLNDDAFFWLEASTTRDGLMLKASRNNTGQTRRGKVYIGIGTGLNDNYLAEISITQAAYKIPDAAADEIDIWKTDGSLPAVNWDSNHRFSSESKSTGGECYAIPQDIWDNVIKGGTFYLTAIGSERVQMRITTGWWSTIWTGNDITTGDERIVENGDGTFTIEINFKGDPILDVIDEQHLLFTGGGYTPLRLFYKEKK